MTALVWDRVGQRYFESGVDRGVFYPNLGVGVVWNGLIGVSEKAVGGTPMPFYSDGYKYLNLASAEEYAATIQAYSAPPEFAVCDGTQSILNGLFVTQQRRQSFGLSYRTKVGNDTDGLEHGYRLHLVYNALASATSRDYRSTTNAGEAMGLSWEITTTPPEITGYRPSAHFVIDSRYTPATIMIEIESLLYGTAGTDPRLPSVSEIMDMFESYVPPKQLNMEFRQPFISTADLTTYTLSNQAIGTAVATRRVIVGISTSSSRAVVSATIGGVTATIDATAVLTGTARLAFISAVVPTGETANIVITLNGAATAMGIALWTIGSGAPKGISANNTVTPVDMQVATALGEVVVAIAHNTGVSASVFDWFGVSERFELDIDSSTETYSAADTVATQTLTTIALNAVGGTVIGLATVYG